jgi:hypothetical protein
MNAASCPRHGDTMDYRMASDDFMCRECGFTATSAEVALTMAPMPAATTSEFIPEPPTEVPISDSQLVKQISEPDADA